MAILLNLVLLNLEVARKYYGWKDTKKNGTRLGQRTSAIQKGKMDDRRDVYVETADRKRLEIKGNVSLGFCGR